MGDAQTQDDHTAARIPRPGLATMGLGVKEKNFIKFLLFEFYVGWGVLGTVLLIALWPHKALTILGAGWLLVTGARLALWVNRMFVRKTKTITPARYGGSWAVVTGASDGIGRAFAIELGRRGFNVVLIARTQSKLESVAGEIAKANGAVKTLVIRADFSHHDRSCYDQIAKAIKGLDVGVLVNNVGIANDIPVQYHEGDAEFARMMIEVNCTSITRMSYMILPQMVARQNGAVINVGSASCAHATPMLAVYSATKAFIKQFSRSLTYEYKEENIDVLSVAPYYVISNLSGIKKPSLLVCTAERFVDDALNKLGYEVHSNPYWVHDFFEWGSTVYAGTPNRLLQVMKSSRDRNLARQAKKAAEAKK